MKLLKTLLISAVLATATVSASAEMTAVIDLPAGTIVVALERPCKLTFAGQYSAYIQTKPDKTITPACAEYSPLEKVMYINSMFPTMTVPISAMRKADIKK